MSHYTVFVLLVSADIHLLSQTIFEASTSIQKVFVFWGWGLVLTGAVPGNWPWVPTCRARAPAQEPLPALQERF